MKSLALNGRKVHRFMSFRQKVFISFLAIFLIFTLLLYPIVRKLIERTQESNLRRRTEELIKDVKAAPNLSAIIEGLKEKKALIFFRVTLLDPVEGALYDTHEEAGIPGSETLFERSEVEEALKEGSGFDVRFSPIFGQKLAYMAVKFHFSGKEYVLRTAFPYGRITTLTRDLSIAFLFVGIAVLLLFSLLSWFIIHVLTRPVHQIIQAIKPYQMGEESHFPKIKLGKSIKPNDDFWQLAETLNSLSQHIEIQIASLTQERNEKSAILESLVEGVIAVDQTMTVNYMNKTAEVFLGIEERELVGENFSLARHPQCTKLIREAQEKNQPVILVLKPTRKRKRFLDAVAVPRGENKGVILVLQDKTSLHKVVEMGRDFIANASHELKTPITIIRGFAETLHDHPELSEEVCLEITEKIVSNCQRMYTLIKNLLALAAIDEGLPVSRLQVCDILDLAEQARLTILSVHPQATIIIETKGEMPFRLMADSDLFYQALLNLFDNAVKYSKPPAQVTLHVEKKERDLVIKVIDKGIGIPTEDLDRVFERFYSVDKSHSRSLGGSGLGLSIVERIIEKHRGKIDVESILGEWTTFTIVIPMHTRF